MSALVHYTSDVMNNHERQNMNLTIRDSSFNYSFIRKIINRFGPSRVSPSDYKSIANGVGRCSVRSESEKFMVRRWWSRGTTIKYYTSSHLIFQAAMLISWVPLGVSFVGRVNHCRKYLAHINCGVSWNNNGSINILPQVSLPINVQSYRFLYSLNVKTLHAKDCTNGLYPRTDITTSHETTNVLFLKGKTKLPIYIFWKESHNAVYSLSVIL